MYVTSSGELSERWRQLLGTRKPSELSRGELRAAFALGDRIPWQYRFALWPAWMEVDKAASGGLTDSDCAVDEVCRRQIEKDMSRTRPNEMNKSQVAVAPVELNTNTIQSTCHSASSARTTKENQRSELRHDHETQQGHNKLVLEIGGSIPRDNFVVNGEDLVTFPLSTRLLPLFFVLLASRFSLLRVLLYS